MATRTRTLYPFSSYGSWTGWGGVTGTWSYERGLYAQCVDESPGGRSALSITKCRVNGGIVDGYWDPDRYSSYPLEASRSGTSFMQFASRNQLGLPPNSALAAQLLAQTNPSRPDIDLPVFLAELRDVPDLIRTEGGKLIRKIAKYNLKYQFAIKPLVNDLMNMVSAVDLVDKRFRELEKLASKGLRRKRNLGSGAVSSNGTVNLNSQARLSILNRPFTRVNASRVWGSVNWFPTGSFPRDVANMRSVARRAVLGLTIDGATAWELIPWSWLVDWYGSVGDYLMASRNIVPCYHDTPFIMEHQVMEYVALVQPPAGLSCSDVHVYAEQKTRDKASPSPLTASLPALTGRQLSILSSLVAGKHRY